MLTKIRWKGVFVVFIVVLGSLGFLVVKALYDPDIAFLREGGQAKWINYGLYPDTRIRSVNFTDLEVKFTKNCYLLTKPAEVELYIKSFKKFRLWINDVEVRLNSDVEANWKRGVSIEATDFLTRGDNKIVVDVFCDYGPPALWLYSRGLSEEIKTDGSWRASISGSPAVSASVADDCVLYPPSAYEPRPFGSFREKLPILVVFFLLSAGIFFFFGHLPKSVRLRERFGLGFLGITPSGVFLIGVIIWGALFINNVTKMPVDLGYDTDGHIKYIEYLIEHRKVPLANEGWAMYQPPLFYFLSGIVLWLGGLFFGGGHALYSLKLIPFLCGIGQIYLVYRAAKIFFPESKRAQNISIIFASFIPMNIYISHYVSNESLCGFLMGLMIFLVLYILSTEKAGLKHYIFLGIVSGLALLTKYTALVLMPIIFIVLLYKLQCGQGFSLKKTAGYLGLTLLVVVAIAGWFYVRNFVHFGKPLVVNWDQAATGFRWWQVPGFHTYRYFCSFGKVFCVPYFAGFYSLFDSLYSTFWGDGMQGGGLYAPWNYDYMSVVYILAVPVTIMIFAGVIRGLAKIFLHNDHLWFLVLGSIFLMLFSLVYMNLKIPIYTAAKSFFGLGVVLPISIVFACGVDLFERRFSGVGVRIFGILFYCLMGTLALTIFFAFLLKPIDRQVPIYRSSLFGVSKTGQPIEYYSQVVKNNPSDAVAYYRLATAYLTENGDYWKAVEHYEKAVELEPDWPDALEGLAQSLLKKPHSARFEKARAVQYAKRSCELTGYLSARPLMTLGAAYIATGQSEKGISMFKKAEAIAFAAGQNQMAEKIKRTLRVYEGRIRGYDKLFDK